MVRVWIMSAPGERRPEIDSRQQAGAASPHGMRGSAGERQFEQIRVDSTIVLKNHAQRRRKTEVAIVDYARVSDPVRVSPSQSNLFQSIVRSGPTKSNQIRVVGVRGREGMAGRDLK